MKRFSFAAITTCKGRLEHLKQTLPAMVKAGFEDVIVVDYDCPDKTSEWVHKTYPQVSIIKIFNQPLFNLAHARNLGASACSADWMCFIDADVEIEPHYLSWLRENVRKRYFYRRRKVRGEEREKFIGLAGSVACQKKAFLKVGGYDEVISGWGGEDVDFYARLDLAGYKQAFMSTDLFSKVLTHDDASRSAFYPKKDKAASDNFAHYYIAAKLDIAVRTGLINIPQALREKLNHHIYQSGRDILEDFSIKKDLRIDLTDEILESIFQKSKRRKRSLKTLHLRPRKFLQRKILSSKAHRRLAGRLERVVLRYFTI